MAESLRRGPEMDDSSGLIGPGRKPVVYRH